MDFEKEDNLVTCLPEELLESLEACACGCKGQAGSGSGTAN